MGVAGLFTNDAQQAHLLQLSAVYRTRKMFLASVLTTKTKLSYFRKRFLFDRPNISSAAP
jgi:hypothetical protein